MKLAPHTLESIIGWIEEQADHYVKHQRGSAEGEAARQRMEGFLEALEMLVEPCQHDQLLELVHQLIA